MIKMWIDDVREAPEGYVWLKSVNEAKRFIDDHISADGVVEIDEFHLDHDAGDYHWNGGDYIRILTYLESCQKLKHWKINAVFKFHSMNPVGVQNMKTICVAANWKIG